MMDGEDSDGWDSDKRRERSRKRRYEQTYGKDEREHERINTEDVVNTESVDDEYNKRVQVTTVSNHQKKKKPKISKQNIDQDEVIVTLQKQVKTLEDQMNQNQNAFNTIKEELQKKSKLEEQINQLSTKVNEISKKPIQGQLSEQNGIRNDMTRLSNQIKDNWDANQERLDAVDKEITELQENAVKKPKMKLKKKSNRKTCNHGGEKRNCPKCTPCELHVDEWKYRCGKCNQ